MKNIYLTLLLFITAIAGAQIVNIPDANFKARLIYNGYDTNTDNEIQVSEAQAVTGTVNLNQSQFADMTGIEAFTNMQYLYCEQNSNIASISLSNMPNLKALHLSYGTNLTSLTLTNLTGLDTLTCNNSKIMGTLDLTTSPGLKSLNCNNNFITALNVSTCTGLKQLFYGGNQVQPADLQLPVANVIEALDCGGNGLSGFNSALYPSLRVLNCGSNAMTNLSLNLPLLEELYVGNNQMTTLSIDPGMTALKHFECAGNPLFTGTLDLTPFTNLEYVNVGATHLTGLNVTGLTNLTWLSCALDDIATLDVSTLANLKTLSCAGNDLTSVDVSNLIHLEELYCNNEFMTTLNISNTPALRIMDCQASLLTSLDLTGCPNLEQLNCSANPLGTLDLSPCPQLYALNCWQNNLTTLDLSAVPNLWALSCHDNQLTTLDCSNNHNLTHLEIYANQLQTLFIKNGSEEYLTEADWIENPDLAYVCADDFQVASLQSQMGALVSINTYCNFTPGDDYNTVTGTVRFDAGNDGCDATDFVIPFMKIDASDGEDSGAVYSNQQGVYTFHTEGTSCSLWPNFENPSYFTMFLPVGIIFPAMNSTVTQDFCVVADGVHPDLEIVIAPVVPARPGFEAVYKIVIRNKGNQVMSMPFGYSFHYNAALMNFVQATTTPDSQGPGLLQWNYANLQPFESRSVEVVLQINTPADLANPVNVGDILTFAAVIESVTGDELPADNAFELPQTVMGSYDPNNLTCLEGDIVSTSEIGNYLHYIANFENTGTDAAQNIVVRTVFDPAKVNVGSLRILNSSDPVEIRVNGNTAEYVFQGINLAIGGHGNILLKIKSNSALVAGDSVLNKADIFFDYNLPVATNEAETVYQMLGVPGSNIDNSIAVFPNPTNGVFNIKANNDIQSVQLYDIQGRLLQMAVRNEPFVTMDISDKQTGVYFIKVISEKGMKVQKILKE